MGTERVSAQSTNLTLGCNHTWSALQKNETLQSIQLSYFDVVQQCIDNSTVKKRISTFVFNSCFYGGDAYKQACFDNDGIICQQGIYSFGKNETNHKKDRFHSGIKFSFCIPNNCSDNSDVEIIDDHNQNKSYFHLCNLQKDMECDFSLSCGGVAPWAVMIGILSMDISVIVLTVLLRYLWRKRQAKKKAEEERASANDSLLFDNHHTHEHDEN